MARKAILSAAALILLLSSCRWGENLDPQARREREAQRLLRKLRYRLYRSIYASLSPRLKEACVEDDLVSSLSRLREAAGERWSPEIVITHTPAHADGAHGLTYALWGSGCADYTLSLWLREQNGAYEKVALEIGMPLSQGRPAEIALMRACRRFLTLLAEGKFVEAEAMIEEPGFAWPRPFLQAIGARYREIANGADCYRLDRHFSEDGLGEAVTLLDDPESNGDIRIFMRRGKDGELKVAGAEFTSPVDQ